MAPALWIFLERQEPWGIHCDIGEPESESSGESKGCSSEFLGITTGGLPR